jgi:hypothetical protein
MTITDGEGQPPAMRIDAERVAMIHIIHGFGQREITRTRGVLRTLYILNQICMHIAIISENNSAIVGKNQTGRDVIGHLN